MNDKQRSTRVLPKREASRNRRVARSSQKPVPWKQIGRRFAALALGLGTLAGAIVVVVFGWQSLHSSERLKIARVEINGNDRAQDVELLAYAGVREGESMLDLDLEQMATNLRRHPWVRNVTVRRRLPDSVQIDVEEHDPAMLVSLGETYIANSDGRIFRKLQAKDGIVLPVLTGLSREVAATDTVATEQRIKDGIELYRAIIARGDALGEVEELHWDEALGWNILVSLTFPLSPGDTKSQATPGSKTTSVRIHLGKQARERLPVVASTLARLRELGRVPAVIWADGVKSPERVHIKLAG